VTDHTTGEQNYAIDENLQAYIRISSQKINERKHDNHQHRYPETSPVPAWIIKTEYVREEINAERNDPKERHDCYILAHLVSNCQKKSGATGSKKQPKNPFKSYFFFLFPLNQFFALMRCHAE
jgi:hypothetical protein